jgi:hypothetical protein
VAGRLAVACTLATALVVGAAGPGAARRRGVETCPEDIGVRVNDERASPGYVLLAPYEQQYTYLVDLDGRVPHQWRTSTRPGNSQVLTERGELVRAGNLEIDSGEFKNGHGAGGRLEALSWDGQTLWQRDFANDRHMQHHQIDVMPNGHVLAILWERISGPEVLAAGRDPDRLPHRELWPDKIIEYDPVTDRVVWQWRVWDHLVQDRDPSKPNYVEDVSARPERIDLNYFRNNRDGTRDFNHLNAVDYNPERDEIVLSSRTFSELWVIDHATTTAQAKGPAGDLLFRWGNPAAHGDEREKRTLFAQHDTEWIDPGMPGEGHLILFNNGIEGRRFSTVDEVVPELDDEGDYGRDPDGGFAGSIRRVYPKPADEEQGEFSAIVSSAQRLPNGDTLIGYGTQGRVLEVTPDAEIVWDYENPYCAFRPGTTRSSAGGFPVSPNWFFQVDRYSPDYPGLARLDL